MSQVYFDTEVWPGGALRGVGQYSSSQQSSSVSGNLQILLRIAGGRSEVHVYIFFGKRDLKSCRKRPVSVKRDLISDF
jgi:hypothetical protein